MVVAPDISKHLVSSPAHLMGGNLHSVPSGGQVEHCLPFNVVFLLGAGRKVRKSDLGCKKNSADKGIRKKITKIKCLPFC